MTGKERYGLAGLDERRGELVRLSNILALRGIKAWTAMHACGGPAVFEQPALLEGEVSMLRLDEFIELLKLQGAEHKILAQCTFGAVSQKLSSFVTAKVSFSDAPESCTHKPRQWFKEVFGEVVTSRHPPTRGVERYFSTMDEARLAARSSAGCFLR